MRASLNELPGRLEGWGVAICNADFISSGRAAEARRRGLRLAWSNEMMWTFREEQGALILGLFDAVLYVSDAQRRALEPLYQRMLSGNGLRATHARRWRGSGKAGSTADAPGGNCAGS